MAVKKLGKRIEGTEVIFALVGEDVRYDSAILPEDMKQRLIVSGLGHKLGDSAASDKTPEEMKASIDRVFNGLLESKWSTRVPGEEREKTPKISKKTILENLSNLPPEQQEAARNLLASMGIAL